MSETYRNRNYRSTRASREMSDKRSKFVRESKFSFLTAIIDHYAYLMDLKKEDGKIVSIRLRSIDVVEEM